MANTCLLHATRSLFFARQRASVPFVTSVVALGLFVDMLNYTLVLSVFPFRLEHLKYSNVSALNGWLFFIFSGAVVLTAPLIASLSEHFRSRRSIMIGGLLCLLVSQLVLMEARSFAIMCIGRLFQGVSSSVGSIAGLALICDTTPEKDIGSQMGIVMAGVPLGALLGPPIGGALYARWGYRAPFVFGMISTALGLVGLVLLVEGSSHQVQDQSHGNEADHLAEKAVTSEERPRNQTLTAAEESRLPNPPTLDDNPTTGTNQLRRKIGDAPILLVFWRLTTSPRPFAVLLVVFFAATTFAASDVTIPLHTQEVWGLDSTKVGLVFIAAIVPTIISSLVAGYLSDKIGPEWVAASVLIASIPWWGALTKQFSLAFFVVSFALENFFIGAVFSPITTELAAVTRGMDGIGYAHMYGVFNMVYGLGSTVGSILGGQIYDHSPVGWAVICYVNAGVMVPCVVAILWYMGEEPILQRIVYRCKDTETRTGNTAVFASEQGTVDNPA